MKKEFVIRNLTDLLGKGVFNIFTTDRCNSLFFVAHFKDKTIFFLRELQGDKYCLTIPSTFGESTKVDFIKELYSIVQLSFKLDKKGRVLTKVNDEPFFKFSLLGTLPAPAGVVPVSVKRLGDFFVSNGIDVTNLTSGLVGSSEVRDYSDLLARSKEAQEAFEQLKVRLSGKLLPDKYLAIAEAVKQGKFNLVYLVGPAGTGKSTLASQFALYCGAPLLTLQGSEGVTREDLIGYTDVKADIKTDDSIDSCSLATPHDASQYTVVEGLLLKAYREGYQITIDEGNFLLSTVLSIINQMTDDCPTYEFKGKAIKRHKNFVLYITGNQGYEGTNLFNPATKSRGITIEVPKLDSNTFVSRMISNNEKLSLDFYKELYKFQDVIQEYADRWGESSSVCIRHALNFSILVTAKPVTYEEFVEMFRISYLNNALSMDSNNYNRVDELLASTEFGASLEKLYGFYDYRVLPDVEPSIAFTEAFDMFDSDWAADEEAKPASDSDLDDEEFEATFSEEDLM